MIPSYLLDSREEMIELFLGPMYAGKTSTLLQMYRERPGDILDYNEKESGIGTLFNHDGKNARCIQLSRLSHYTGTASRIYINEAQFFPDLLDFVRKNEHLNLYLFGLDGDFQRNPMGQILQVIPLCDSIVKLKGTCSRCSKPSLFSKRITSDTQQFLLDETAYTPLCRSCYLT